MDSQHDISSDTHSATGILAPQVGAVAPRRRRSRGRRRLAAVLCGVAIGLVFGLLMGYRSTVRPTTHSPHAGQNDFVASNAESSEASQDAQSTYEQYAAGFALCPVDDVLTHSDVAPTQDRPARGSIGGIVSYQIEERTVLRDGRQIKTHFMFVDSGSTVPLCIEHHDPTPSGHATSSYLFDDVIACIPILGPAQHGMIWIGDDPVSCLTVKPTGEDGQAYIPSKRYQDAYDPLVRKNELQSLSLDYTNGLGACYQGPFALVTDTYVLDLPQDMTALSFDERSPVEGSVTLVFAGAAKALPLVDSADIYASGQLEAQIYVDT